MSVAAKEKKKHFKATHFLSLYNFPFEKLNAATSLAKGDSKMRLLTLVTLQFICDFLFATIGVNKTHLAIKSTCNGTASSASYKTKDGFANKSYSAVTLEHSE